MYRLTGGRTGRRVLELLDLEPIEVNIFRGASLDDDADRVFGGQVAAQALVAAGRTVERGRVHSLHSYFLRPGDPTVPILYEVDRIRDGRSFTTRRVVAIQHGEAIFNLGARSTPTRTGLDHQDPMPDVPDPEASAAADPRATRIAPWRPSQRRGPPRAIRLVGGPPGEGHERRAQLWLRTGAPLGDDPLVHAAIVDLRLGPLARRHDPPAPRHLARRPTVAARAASTTACGSTGPSGPTTGSSTTRRSPGGLRRAGLRSGALYDADGTGRDASPRRACIAAPAGRAVVVTGRRSTIGFGIFIALVVVLVVFVVRFAGGLGRACTAALGLDAPVGEPGDTRRGVLAQVRRRRGGSRR